MPDESELAAVGLPTFEYGRAHLFRAAGCESCSLRGLIERSTEEIFAAAVEAGMTTMREDAIRLALAGIASLAEVRRVSGERMTSRASPAAP